MTENADTTTQHDKATLDKSSAIDACKSVYENATRNHDFETSRQETLNSLFDYHCEMNGEVKQSSLGIDLSFTIKQIPLEFGGTSNDYAQRLHQFCKKYAEYMTTSSYTQRVRDRVVTEALNSFNKCVSLAQAGVVVDVAETDSSGSFLLKFSSDTVKVRLENIILGDNIHCKTVIPAQAGGTSIIREVNAGANEIFDIELINNTAISCTRSELTSNGIKYYPETNIIFTTNHYPYKYIFPQIGLPGPSHIVDFIHRLDGVDGKMATLDNKINTTNQKLTNTTSDLTKAITAVKKTIPQKYYFVHLGSNSGRRYPELFSTVRYCYYDLNLLGRELCQPKGYNVDHLAYLTHGGGNCGHEYYIVTCSQE